MEITLLSEHPEYFETVGSWIYEQWWQTPDNTPEVVFNQLRPHLKKDVFPYTIVATVEGESIGSCCVIENDCPLRPQYIPWVAAVYVKPEMRGQGIASGVLQKALRVARRLGISGLYIDCWAKTAPLYEQNGWEILESDVGQRDSLVMYQRIDSSSAAGIG